VSLESAQNESPRAGRWLGLAVASLMLAGFFALFLVVARVPPFSGWVTDPAFFKRCLVVHVDLSLVVWFYAFTAGLFALLPTRGQSPGLERAGFTLALCGVAALIAGIFLPGVQPVLSNYVPALDHPLFLVGLTLFLFGVGFSFLGPRLLPAREAPRGRARLPEEARPGLRVAAIAYWMALFTFLATLSAMPEGLPAAGRYELMFWGLGHVLQFASVAAMLSVWLMLLTPALGRAPLSRSAALVAFGWLLLPTLAAPLLAMQGAQQGSVHGAFTQLMRWGIFPPVLFVLVLCLRAVVRARADGRVRLFDPSLYAFWASAALTVTGFVLGALIRGSNTIVPAHYHANIGAVTAAFMGVAPAVLADLGFPAATPRLWRISRWQPALFGAGQLVFALGFGLAGAQGMARKTYGSEQHIRTAAEWAGLTIMGLGGLVAIAGGVLFLTYVVRAFGPARQLSLLAVAARRRSWPKRVASTPSRP
jgi:cytochrome c oxidase subunit I